MADAQTERDAAVTALATALYALIDELHETGAIDRAAVADRLRRLRRGGEPIPMVEAIADNIATGHFADAPHPTGPRLALAVDNDQA